MKLIGIVAMTLCTLTVLFSYIHYCIVKKSKNKVITPDPLDEVEIYLAYGRKENAISILEKALREKPNRKDIETKLLQLKK
jgi:hypothetical protein